MRFTKMHGLGNDFAIFDGRAAELDVTPEQIRRLSDRRTGIGFDQLVILAPAKSAGSDVFLKMYNADGGPIESCGNATRCVAALLFDELKKAEVALETSAVSLTAKKAGNRVTVDMGPAYLKWQEIPLSHEENTLSLPVSEGGLTNPVGVGMGNPHAVFFVKNAETVPLETLGPKVEHHSLFPARTNVEVAQVLSPTRIRMRVWERGTGITQACGTGACAVAVAGVRRGLTERNISIILDGGILDIEWREADGHVLMTGDVALSYRGEVEI